MPLTGQQITYLAQVFDEQWTAPTLHMFADKLNVNLDNVAPNALGVTFKQRAVQFINIMNASRPPRDRELLEQLRLDGNAILREVANKLLTPGFVSLTADPHDAIILGRKAFIGRTDLRQVIREFTNPTPWSTRVLIIQGDQPGGKSYSYEFLRHLALSVVGALPQRLQLKDKGYTPRDLVEQSALLLGLDLSGLPKMTDDPQLARIDPLINWFKGKLPTLAKAYWLVIDDLNEASVTPATREAAYALAYVAEEVKGDLWVALLGYNWPVTDPDLRFIAQERAQFPNAASVAQHFECIAKTSPKPLTATEAQEIAMLLFTQFSTIDKENMIKLTMQVERLGERLSRGLHPQEQPA